MIFFEKQFKILIEREILYLPIYLLFSRTADTEKKTWLQWKDPQSASIKNLTFFNT